jgi:mRNA interferase RelE/StbE
VKSDLELHVDAQAVRDLKRLAKSHHPVLARLKRAIDSLKADPFQGKALKGAKEGCRSIREGDFRIIYEVFQKQRAVLIIRVGDRKEIYR